MLKDRQCRYESHIKKNGQFSNIVGMCFKQDCKYNSLLCKKCIFDKHQDHLNDCQSLFTIKTNLLKNLNKQEQSNRIILRLDKIYYILHIEQSDVFSEVNLIEFIQLIKNYYYLFEATIQPNYNKIQDILLELDKFYEIDSLLNDKREEIVKTRNSQVDLIEKIKQVKNSKFYLEELYHFDKNNSMSYTREVLEILKDNPNCDFELLKKNTKLIIEYEPFRVIGYLYYCIALLFDMQFKNCIKYLNQMLIVLQFISKEEFQMNISIRYSKEEFMNQLLNQNNQLQQEYKELLNFTHLSQQFKFYFNLINIFQYFNYGIEMINLMTSRNIKPSSDFKKSQCQAYNKNIQFKQIEECFIIEQKTNRFDQWFDIFPYDLGILYLKREQLIQNNQYIEAAEINDLIETQRKFKIEEQSWFLLEQQIKLSLFNQNNKKSLKNFFKEILKLIEKFPKSEQQIFEKILILSANFNETRENNLINYSEYDCLWTEEIDALEDVKKDILLSLILILFNVDVLIRLCNIQKNSKTIYNKTYFYQLLAAYLRDVNRLQEALYYINLSFLSQLEAYDRFRSYFVKCDILVQLNKFDEALICSNKILKHYDKIDGWQTKIMIYRKQGKYNLTHSCYIQALQLLSNIKQGNHQQQKYLIMFQEFAKDLELIKQLNIKLQDPYLEGIQLLQQNKINDAKECFILQAQIQPKSQIYQILGDILYFQKQYQQANKKYYKALQYQYINVDYIYQKITQIGIKLMLQNKFNDAQQCFINLPDNSQKYQILGDILLLQKQFEQAQNYYNQALTLQNNNKLYIEERQNIIINNKKQ